MKIFQSQVCLHEILHALGFEHEHERPDRENYIQINMSNVRPDYRSAYRTISGDEYNFVTPYDISSIMHYGAKVLQGPEISKFQPKSSGFQFKPSGFRPKSSGFQSKSSGFQPKPSGFQYKPSGFQFKPSGFGLHSLVRNNFAKKGEGEEEGGLKVILSQDHSKKKFVIFFPTSGICRGRKIFGLKSNEYHYGIFNWELYSKRRNAFGTGHCDPQ